MKIRKNVVFLLLLTPYHCHEIIPFNHGVIPSDASLDTLPADMMRDLEVNDLPYIDHDVAPDVTTVDVIHAIYGPFSTDDLLSILKQKQVDCIGDDGISSGEMIKIFDSEEITFIVPTNVPDSTSQWLDSYNSVMVVWDINSCGDEDPMPGNNLSWGSAGILVRGATLDKNNQLILNEDLTEKDLNLVDCEIDGSIQNEFALPDDSELSLYPQLVQPVNAAKQSLLEAAREMAQ